MSGSTLRLGLVTLGDVAAPELVRLARAAEGAGIDAFWISDEPFYRGAIAAGAACAVTTSRIRIGIGVVNPWEHPPVVMARNFATIQEAAEGRAILGVAAGWRPPIESQGLPFGKGLSAVKDAVTVIRALLRSETVTYEGNTVQIDSVKLSFASAYPDSHIYVASMFPRSLEQAGRLADGVLLSILCPREYLEAAASLVASGAHSAGRDPAEIELVQYLLFHCDHDRESAVQVMKSELARFITHSYDPEPDHWQKVAELGSFDLEEFEHISQRLRGGASPSDAVSDSFVRRFAVAGSPSECVEGLESFSAAGMDQAGLVFCEGADRFAQLDMVARFVCARSSVFQADREERF